MKTNWLAVTNRINKDRYRIPAGWETKEQVAESLQCDPGRVHELLRPAIASGEVERQEFSVWDDKRRCTVRVACYRLAQSQSGKQSQGADSLNDRIAASIRRNPNHTNNQIAKNFNGVCAADVAAVRKTIAN